MNVAPKKTTLQSFLNQSARAAILMQRVIELAVKHGATQVMDEFVFPSKAASDAFEKELKELL